MRKYLVKYLVLEEKAIVLTSAELSYNGKCATPIQGAEKFVKEMYGGHKVISVSLLKKEEVQK